MNPNDQNLQYFVFSLAELKIVLTDVPMVLVCVAIQHRTYGLIPKIRI